MKLKRKLYIVSIVFLCIAIFSQVFVESPLFEGFYPENQWDRLRLALWITLLVTLPAAGIAIASFYSRCSYEREAKI
jgi:membrane protease YdiL (CAAX protease family)